MPFNNQIKENVYAYCNNHLPPRDWYESTFNFIQDGDLRRRLIDEFMGARFAYKLFEGLEAKEENKRFEIRHQILSYASIYEAIIHYVLFTLYADTAEVDNLLHHAAVAKVSIPLEKKKQIEALLVHDGEEIIPYKMQRRKRGISQIRFDAKCGAMKSLGLIYDFVDKEGSIVDIEVELNSFYECRNAIHLHAEQRKNLEYELEMSKKAYWRFDPFIKQVKEGLIRDNKVSLE